MYTSAFAMPSMTRRSTGGLKKGFSSADNPFVEVIIPGMETRALPTGSTNLLSVCLSLVPAPSHPLHAVALLLLCRCFDTACLSVPLPVCVLFCMCVVFHPQVGDILQRYRVSDSRADTILEIRPPKWLRSTGLLEGLAAVVNTGNSSSGQQHRST